MLVQADTAEPWPGLTLVKKQVADLDLRCGLRSDPSWGMAKYANEVNGGLWLASVLICRNYT